MEQSTICFIVNSRIGEKKIQQLNEAIKQFIDSPYELHYTQFGGHATELTKKALEKKAKIIVAVGGDGTVNEIIQLVAKSQTVLAIVPTGSGNGLARHCQIPLKIDQAVKLVSSGQPVKIDLGKANDIYFISNAGVGFDATVCQAIKETKSRGLKMYILKVIQHYFTYKADTYQIESAGKTFTEKAFFLNVANGKEFGYGFEIAPEATLQDGMLDMILVKSIHFWNGFKFVWDGWNKRLSKNKNCLYLRTTAMKIQGKNLNYFQTDGDSHSCQGTCMIEVHPHSLSILVPTSLKQI